ncbi:MAG: hypothetical protein ACOC97_01030 [Myxococcota bacterium]
MAKSARRPVEGVFHQGGRGPTPTQVIPIRSRAPRPEGVLWELLSEDKRRAIPVLRHLRGG